jgi:hypothetical protein
VVKKEYALCKKLLEGNCPTKEAGSSPNLVVLLWHRIILEYKEIVDIDSNRFSATQIGIVPPFFKPTG